MTYQVHQGTVISDRGIPELPRWFSDGRLSFQFDGFGVTQVDYRSPKQRRGSHVIFLQRLWSGFRLHAERGGVLYRPQYRHTRLQPFGLASEWELEGFVVEYRLFAAAETILFQLVTPADMPAGWRLRLEFYHDFGLIPNDLQDMRYADSGSERVWEPWIFDPSANCLRGLLRDVPRVSEAGVSGHGPNINNMDLEQEDDGAAHQLHLAVSADVSLYYQRMDINAKYVLRTADELEPGRGYSFAVAMAPERAEAERRAVDASRSSASQYDKQISRYLKVAERNPVLISPYAELNDFISLAPAYHESCKVPETPGAVKAKNANYWVWGWDGMTSNYASLYWGDQQFIRDMLRFYEETADEKHGIGHSFGPDMLPKSVSALPAQGMYITLLHQYYVFTQDREELETRYPFALKVFARIMQAEEAGTGLSRGASLFPDFPSYMEETGNDLSSFNNTILYCTARSLEAIACRLGDEEAADRARRVFRDIERHYLPLFFDKDKGFVVSSVDASTKEQRDSYNANAVKWENFYASELMETVNRQALQFFEENVVCNAGLREIPVWSRAYDKDANQLHCWWPVTGEYYMQLINEGNRKDLIEQWTRWVGYWTRKLICPEGIPCNIDTDEPEQDRWNSASGTWHAYSMRGWYQAAIHGVAGIGIEDGGMTIYPYGGEEMTLLGLHYANRRFDIELLGSGRYIEAIEINGVRLAGTHKLPSDLFGAEDGGRVSVKVRRTDSQPLPVAIRRGHGIELTGYRQEGETIEALAHGAGTCRLKLDASRKPVVLCDGVETEVRYNGEEGSAIAELALRPGVPVRLQIQ